MPYYLEIFKCGWIVFFRGEVRAEKKYCYSGEVGRKAAISWGRVSSLPGRTNDPQSVVN